MSSLALTPGIGTNRTAVRRGPVHVVQLTRRGRLVLLALFVVLALAVLGVLGSQSAASDAKGAPVHTRTVEVRSGDTLWELAASVAGPGQVRAMVHQIEELNALPGSGLRVGQQIAVPAG